MKSLTVTPIVTGALLLAAALTPHWTQAASLSLSGTDHIGYIALANVNTELLEPNGTGGGKSSFNMPYYYNPDFVHDSGTGAWFYLVTTPRSPTADYSAISNTTYANPFPGGVTSQVYNTGYSANEIITGATWNIGGYTGGTVTTVNFGHTNFGSIDYDTAGLNLVGTETLNISASNFTFDLFELGPKYTLDNANSNNEFNWDYVVETATGNVQLTFTDGVLTSIDGTLDVGLAIRFGGIDLGKFNELDNPSQVALYEGTLSFSGNTFAWNVDDYEDVSSFLGQLTDTRLIFNRSGTIDGISAVPEPSTYAAIAGGLALLGAILRRRKQ